ncbi:MAG: hypothetical protein KKD05_05145 [Candidatus Omnitrophica bacterium]|nr:hypothetical protein [Candidatus Omnitrophota bacterium]
MQNDVPVLSLLQQLKEGIIDAKSIDKDTRRQLVEVLHSEDYTIYQMAQFFKCSEKTVQRDLVQVRKQNALSPSAEFAKELIGEMLTRARQHYASLGRLSKNASATVQDKIMSEVSSWKVFKEMIEKFQSLGYLPLKSQQIEGDIYHHMLSEDESLEDTKKILLEIENVAKETSSFTPELSKEIKNLSARIKKAETVIDVKKLAEKQNHEMQNKEDENE